MSLGVTTDNSVLAILKEYYGVQDVELLVFRNSSLLGAIKKERVGGKYIPLPMAVYGSGAVTSDYLQVTQQATNSYLAISMQLTPGKLFSSFVLDPEEHLASQGDRAAFISVFALRAMLAMDDLRKVLATALYRSGYLETGTVVTADTSYLYVDVDPSTAMCLSPNSQILFAPTPSGTLRSASAVTISTIQTVQASGLTRITFTSAFVSTVAAGDYLLIKGGRDGSGNPNAPVGFAGWLPTNNNRTGSSWTTYIGTSFFGVNRSVAPDRLAGNYILRATTEDYTEALIRGIKAARRGGGVVNKIVVNDDDFNIIMQDVLKNRSFMQQINTAGNSGKNMATQGITQLQMSYSTSWIDDLVDDPYCPKNFAYILDMDAIRLFGISNTGPILDKLPINNEPGGPSITDTAAPTTEFRFLVDDMYTTSPVALSTGMGIRVDFQMYAQFAVLNPAHCAVVQFN